LIDLFVDWFLVSLVDWLFAWLPGLLVDCSVLSLFPCFLLAGWLFLFRWLLGLLVGLSVDWSVGWLVG